MNGSKLITSWQCSSFGPDPIDTGTLLLSWRGNRVITYARWRSPRKPYQNWTKCRFFFSFFLVLIRFLPSTCIKLFVCSCVSKVLNFKWQRRFAWLPGSRWNPADAAECQLRLTREVNLPNYPAFEGSVRGRTLLEAEPCATGPRRARTGPPGSATRPAAGPARPSAARPRLTKWTVSPSRLDTCWWTRPSRTWRWSSTANGSLLIASSWRRAATISGEGHIAWFTFVCEDEKILQECLKSIPRRHT